MRLTGLRLSGLLGLAGRVQRKDVFDQVAAGERRCFEREPRPSMSTEGAALPRILRTYVAARAALGLALLLAPWLAWLMGGRTPLLLLALCLAYAGQAVSLWLLGQLAGTRPVPRRPWLWTVGVDLLVFSLLRLLDPLGQFNFAALLVLPVLMAGALTQRRLAMATAAGVTLMLLGVAWLTAAEGVVLLAQWSQAGLAGAGMFMVSWLASELAQRLAREERSARSSLGLAHQQTLLNRLVIEELADGVMVMDRQGLVRTLNPAARALLGAMDQAMVVPFMLADQPGLHGLQQALDQAFQQGRWPDAAREICLALADGDVRTLQLRARFTRRGGIGADDKPPEDICVLFLQDLRSVQDQARQHKLAAMGQVSAGIAHEIRNPLAAISQATALLLEDELQGTQRQLAHIVADNAWRLKRIVDDVLAAAPGPVSTPVVIDARIEVALVFDDWCRASSAQTRVADHLICDFPNGSLPAYFDVEHLRRVLVNLLDNAVRHASPSSGAVCLSLVAGPLPGTVTLSVASDGVAMAAEVERHLFEPFFSTRSRGSGLGLYICRELCERHGANIEFSPGPVGSRYSHVFAVMMRAGPAV